MKQEDLRAMKNPGLLLGALSSLALLFGCGGTAPDEHGAADHEHHDKAVEHMNSERWQANPETTDGIQGMQALADGYPANGLTSGQLRDSLSTRMALIFDRCTMKGDAHDALHRYLSPLQGSIARIHEGSSKASLDSLRQHLRHYDKVFY